MEDFVVKEIENIKNIIQFSRLKKNFFENQTFSCPNKSVEEYVRKLDESGVLIIPEFLTKEDCKFLLSKQPEDEKFMLSPEGDMSKFYLNADQDPNFSSFFYDERIDHIMKGYIGDSAVPLRQSMEIRSNKGAVNAFDRMFHMDTWKYRVKAFLYLHDVTEDDAPLCYLKRSHKGDWRLPMEYRMATQYQTGGQGYASDLDKAWLGCYWPYEIAEFKSQYNLEEIVCTGQAGTLIVFDARGLHKATDLVNDYRKVLISYFISEGNHI